MYENWKDIQIETERCTLLPQDLGAIEKVFQYYRNNRMRFEKWLPCIPDQFENLSYWEKRVEDSVEMIERKSALPLNVFETKSNQIIGLVDFSMMFDFPFSACTLGFTVDKDFESNGYVTEVVKSAISFVFEELNFHSIQASHIPENIRSRKVLERLGFDSIGVSKEYLFMNGCWKDNLLYNLVNPNWRNLD